MDINKKIFNKILAMLIQKSFRAHMTLFQKLLQIYKCSREENIDERTDTQINETKYRN